MEGWDNVGIIFLFLDVFRSRLAYLTANMRALWHCGFLEGEVQRGRDPLTEVKTSKPSAVITVVLSFIHPPF